MLWDECIGNLNRGRFEAVPEPEGGPRVTGGMPIRMCYQSTSCQSINRFYRNQGGALFKEKAVQSECSSFMDVINECISCVEFGRLGCT